MTTEYQIKTDLEVKENCIKAIARIREEADLETIEYQRIMAGLNARLKDCEETIARINTRLALARAEGKEIDEKLD